MGKDTKPMNLLRDGDPLQDKFVKEARHQEEGRAETGEPTTGKGQRKITHRPPMNDKFDNPDRY